MAADSSRSVPRRTLSPALRAAVWFSAISAFSSVMVYAPLMLWTVLLILLAVGVLCVAYGVVVEHHWFRLRRYQLDILPRATWPAGDGGLADGLTILHLS